MIKDFHGLVNVFIRILKEAIWRPPLSKGNPEHYLFYKVPMRMPKLHALAFHVVQFVRLTGYWGLLVRNALNRKQHAVNLCSGAQLLSNLEYSLVSSMPSLRALRISGEQTKRIREAQYAKNDSVHKEARLL